MRDVLANDQPAVPRADSGLYAAPAVPGGAARVQRSHANIPGQINYHEAASDCRLIRSSARSASDTLVRARIRF